jgi:hypothetical protein
MKQLIFISFIIVCQYTFGQVTQSKIELNNNMFLKQKLYGFSFNNSWVGFHDWKDSTFLKPVLGLHADYNYFFNEKMGISIQAGLQMRGVGIITPDYDNSVGNQDSTGRQRHNVRSLEVPIQFYYRPTKEIVKNSRLVLGIGLVPMYHQKVVRKWYSVDDGFHTPISYKSNYHMIDFPLRLSSGLDVNVAGGNLFRGALIMDIGLKNNYKNPVTGVKSSKHFLLGVQMSFLF